MSRQTSSHRFHRLAPLAGGLLVAFAASATPAAGCPQAASAGQPPCPPPPRSSGPVNSGSTLTRQAHEEHQRRMASFKSYEECRAYLDDWQARMQHGDHPAPRPTDDACAGLPRLKP